LGFKREFAADEDLIDVEKLQQIHKIVLDDAVVAIRREDGRIKIKHSNILLLSDATKGCQFGLVLAGLPGHWRP
jgi:uncharacterized membrane protein